MQDELIDTFNQEPPMIRLREFAVSLGFTVYMKFCQNFELISQGDSFCCHIISFQNACVHL